MVRSLETRLVLAVSVIAVAGVTAVALVTRQTARGEFLRFRELERKTSSERREEDARKLAQTLEDRCCPLEAPAPTLAEDEAIFVLDPEGKTLLGRGEPLASLEGVDVRREGDLLIVDALREQGPAVDHLRLRLHDPGRPLRLRDGREGRLYVVPFRRTDEDRRTAAYLVSLDLRVLWATLLGAVALVVLTSVVARRVIGPLRELCAAVEDLGTGDVDRRVTVRGSGEVAELGRRFNTMAAELGRQQALRRNLIHDVAHELRTPVTALRCRIEALLDGLSSKPEQAYEDMRDEVLHLGKLVDDLQELALAEARELRLDIGSVAVAPVVLSAARAARLEKDPRLRIEIAPGLGLRGDAVRIRQVLLNLLSNAARHTPEEGVIRVCAFSRVQEIVVEVENTGSTLSDEEIAHVFDRFYRTDPARQRATGGSGLGLAIVKSLIEAHGGSVWARSGRDAVTVGFAVPGGV